jgi:hypothetical protein
MKHVENHNKKKREKERKMDKEACKGTNFSQNLCDIAF